MSSQTLPSAAASVTRTPAPSPRLHSTERRLRRLEQGRRAAINQHAKSADRNRGGGSQSRRMSSSPSLSSPSSSSSPKTDVGATLGEVNALVGDMLRASQRSNDYLRVSEMKSTLEEATNKRRERLGKVREGTMGAWEGGAAKHEPSRLHDNGAAVAAAAAAVVAVASRDPQCTLAEPTSYANESRDPAPVPALPADVRVAPGPRSRSASSSRSSSYSVPDPPASPITSSRSPPDPSENRVQSAIASVESMRARLVQRRREQISSIARGRARYLYYQQRAAEISERRNPLSPERTSEPTPPGNNSHTKMSKGSTLKEHKAVAAAAHAAKDGRIVDRGYVQRQRKTEEGVEGRGAALKEGRSPSRDGSGKSYKQIAAVALERCDLEWPSPDKKRELTPRTSLRGGMNLFSQQEMAAEENVTKYRHAEQDDQAHIAPVDGTAHLDDDGGCHRENSVGGDDAGDDCVLRARRDIEVVATAKSTMTRSELIKHRSFGYDASEGRARAARGNRTALSPDRRGYNLEDSRDVQGTERDNTFVPRSKASTGSERIKHGRAEELGVSARGEAEDRNDKEQMEASDGTILPSELEEVAVKLRQEREDDSIQISKVDSEDNQCVEDIAAVDTGNQEGGDKSIGESGSKDVLNVSRNEDDDQVNSISPTVSSGKADISPESALSSRASGCATDRHFQDNAESTSSEQIGREHSKKDTDETTSDFGATGEGSRASSDHGDCTEKQSKLCDVPTSEICPDGGIGGADSTVQEEDQENEEGNEPFVDELSEEVLKNTEGVVQGVGNYELGNEDSSSKGETGTISQNIAHNIEGQDRNEADKGTYTTSKETDDDPTIEDEDEDKDEGKGKDEGEEEDDEYADDDECAVEDEDEDEITEAEAEVEVEMEKEEDEDEGKEDDENKGTEAEVQAEAQVEKEGKQEKIGRDGWAKDESHSATNSAEKSANSVGIVVPKNEVVGSSANTGSALLKHDGTVRAGKSRESEAETASSLADSPIAETESMSTKKSSIKDGKSAQAHSMKSSIKGTSPRGRPPVPPFSDVCAGSSFVSVPNEIQIGNEGRRRSFIGMGKTVIELVEDDGEAGTISIEASFSIRNDSTHADAEENDSVGSSLFSDEHFDAQNADESKTCEYFEDVDAILGEYTCTKENMELDANGDEIGNSGDDISCSEKNSVLGSVDSRGTVGTQANVCSRIGGEKNKGISPGLSIQTICPKENGNGQKAATEEKQTKMNKADGLGELEPREGAEKGDEIFPRVGSEESEVISSSFEARCSSGQSIVGLKGKTRTQSTDLLEEQVASVVNSENDAASQKSNSLAKFQESFDIGDNVTANNMDSFKVAPGCGDGRQVAPSENSPKDVCIPSTDRVDVADNSHIRFSFDAFGLGDTGHLSHCYNSSSYSSNEKLIVEGVGDKISISAKTGKANVGDGFASLFPSNFDETSQSDGRRLAIPNGAMSDGCNDGKGDMDATLEAIAVPANEGLPVEEEEKDEEDEDDTTPICSPRGIEGTYDFGSVLVETSRSIETANDKTDGNEVGVNNGSEEANIEFEASFSQEHVQILLSSATDGFPSEDHNARNSEAISPARFSSSHIIEDTVVPTDEVKSGAFREVVSANSSSIGGFLAKQGYMNNPGVDKYGTILDKEVEPEEPTQLAKRREYIGAVLTEQGSELSDAKDKYSTPLAVDTISEVVTEVVKDKQEIEEKNGGEDDIVIATSSDSSVARKIVEAANAALFPTDIDESVSIQNKEEARWDAHRLVWERPSVVSNESGTLASNRSIQRCVFSSIDEEWDWDKDVRTDEGTECQVEYIEEDNIRWREDFNENQVLSLSASVSASGSVSFDSRDGRMKVYEKDFISAELSENTSDTGDSYSYSYAGASSEGKDTVEAMSNEENDDDAFSGTYDGLDLEGHEYEISDWEAVRRAFAGAFFCGTTRGLICGHLLGSRSQSEVAKIATDGRDLGELNATVAQRYRATREGSSEGSTEEKKPRKGAKSIHKTMLV